MRMGVLLYPSQSNRWFYAGFCSVRFTYSGSRRICRQGHHGHWSSPVPSSRVRHIGVDAGNVPEVHGARSTTALFDDHGQWCINAMEGED